MFKLKWHPHWRAYRLLANQIYEKIGELVKGYKIEQVRRELSKANARLNKLVPFGALISVGEQTSKILNPIHKAIDEDPDSQPR